MTEDERLHLLVDISRMYYEYNYSQADISNRVGLSRTYISKLLDEAKERGIVEFYIPNLEVSESFIEEDLRTRYNLTKAIIVPSDGATVEELGEAAARYFDSILQDNDIIGVSWGAPLYTLSHYIQPRKDLQKLHVVQICSSLCKIEQNIYNSEIAQNIARCLNAECHLIPLPAVFDSITTRNAAMKDRGISTVLELAQNANIVIFTAGAFTSDSTFVQSGYFSESELCRLKDSGAVGDIASHIINEKGELCSNALDQRTVAISYENILTIPTRIGIAYGSQKLDVIRAALNAHCFTVFVTDEETAQALLS